MLSDAEIRRKAPGEKPLKLWDGDGLHLLVTSAGAKLWHFDYRYGGKRKTISFGAYSEVSLAAARDRRREARAWLRDGRDPSIERRAEKRRRVAESARSFAVVFEEWRARQSELYAPTLTRYDSVYGQLPASLHESPHRADRAARCARRPPTDGSARSALDGSSGQDPRQSHLPACCRYG